MRTGRTRIAGTLPVLIAALAGCSGAPPAADPTWVASVEQWRAHRLERLEAPDGWLTLIGLDWLEAGNNRIGSAPGCAVRLPEDVAPAELGSLVVDGAAVRVEPRAGAGLRLDGETLTGPATLRSDADGAPNVLSIGTVSFYLIRRGERLAARVKRSDSPVRTGFPGLEYYPIDRRFRVEATFERYDVPREVDVPTMLGTVEKGLAIGRARFAIDGRSMTLEPTVGSPDDRELFFVFKDRTSGHGTYPSGRFLYATLGTGDRVVLDFNEAYNPPCAFTPYATCPLPTPENTLGVPIEAGEKDFAHRGLPVRAAG